MTEETKRGYETEEPSAAQPPPVTDQVQQETEALWEEASRQGRHYLAGRKDALAGQVNLLAGALGRAAGEIDQPEGGLMRHYLERTARSLEEVSGSMQEQDLDALLTRVRKIGREQPAAMLGGSIAIGMLMGRFLQSSSPEEGRESAAERSAGDVSRGRDEPESKLRETAEKRSEEEYDVTKH